jgi:hypothetical protein
MRTEFTGTYASDWKEIATAIKDAAQWRCVRCDHPHEPEAGYTLTVHHLDGDKSNNAWWNTPALDQRCHLHIQSKVVMARPWMLEHSEWFRPYAGGYFAWFYLGLDLSRAEVEANLDYYANLQREILGVTA